jgi:hypothetical protein
VELQLHLIKARRSTNLPLLVAFCSTHKSELALTLLQPGKEYGSRQPRSKSNQKRSFAGIISKVQNFETTQRKDASFLIKLSRLISEAESNGNEQVLLFTPYISFKQVHASTVLVFSTRQLLAEHVLQLVLNKVKLIGSIPAVHFFTQTNFQRGEASENNTVYKHLDIKANR